LNGQHQNGLAQSQLADLLEGCGQVDEALLPSQNLQEFDKLIRAKASLPEDRAERGRAYIPGMIWNSNQ
jgi:hypothetical protein